MFRKFLLTCLMLSIGLSPMTSAWAGIMSAAQQDEVMMAEGHDHHAMQQAMTDDDQASSAHCKMKCAGNCDSSCCSTNACSTCGHCAAALINPTAVLPINTPHPPLLSAHYTPESREFTPPFRPPLLLHS